MFLIVTNLAACAARLNSTYARPGEAFSVHRHLSLHSLELHAAVTCRSYRHHTARQTTNKQETPADGTSCLETGAKQPAGSPRPSPFLLQRT